MQQGWGTWDASWAWSIALIAATIAIHAVGVVAIAALLLRLREWKGSFFRTTMTGATIVIAGTGVALAVLHGAECVVWAIAYIRLGAIASPAEALLYSVDSMTTRGASSLVLEGHWQMMGALEAADGMLVFGISTAMLLAVMTRLFPAVFKDRSA